VVLMSDNLRDIGMLSDTVNFAKLLTISTELLNHLKASPTAAALPGKSAIYDWRVDLDLASMLYARDHVFVGDFAAHLRLDSSPQFGKDYLMGECDIVRCLVELDVSKIMTRLLVTQCVGVKASSTAHKYSKLGRMTSLEASNPAEFNLQVYSMLTDMGTNAEFVCF
jgi:hypothetical protein